MSGDDVDPLHLVEFVGGKIVALLDHTRAKAMTGRS